ncbi:hypothetical protein ACQP2U_43525 (plasmid) [Nocardia sp. CA-084685]|uniref:hypothetical protein n=1 Tax=Nocardia sp. CA-084685 TaxID=3239970 RepID=UPI003D97482C
MTWYTITHSCTHEVPQHVHGDNRSQRDWKAKQLEQQICNACFARDQKTERDGANAAALAAADAAEWPALTGTEKQVPWAASLRARALALLDVVAEVAAGNPHHPEGGELVAPVREMLLSQTTAQSWITFRDKNFNAMITAWATPDERGRWRDQAGIDRFPDSVLRVANNRFFAREQ